ncbi:subtilisin-like protein [Gymnopilus junonius]|uniref:tripeptidyl-peptidase II n=1 Tax=Gymnopilus junonius TaxID=109634 RepID=A0A9P5P3M0_GYMJU|nr:subtilisin-like protein [Gymnopilus junonius]
MRIHLTLVSFLLGTSLSFAAPPKECAYKVKEEIYPPRGWVKHSRPHPDHPISLRIGLPQHNFPLLEQHLYEVSDPEHPRYGEYLSKEEVEALAAPRPESLNALDKWLAGFDFKEEDLVRSPAKDWITITIPISLAEKMLDTTYHVWEHTDSGDQLVRTTRYSLPGDLHGHVDVIQPTTMFGRYRRDRATIFRVEEITDELEKVMTKVLPPVVNAVSGITVDQSCNSTITISCLQQLYNAVGYVASANPENSIGATGYLEEFANLQDLRTFYAEQRPDALNSTFKFVSVKGGLNTQNLSQAGGEANLDTQFAFGLSHPIPPTFFSTAGRPPFDADARTPTDTNEPYTDWLDFILSQPDKDIPRTISTSYGDDEQTVPKDFATRACAEFAKLGARGVTVIFSSGDFGVGDGDSNPSTQQCFTNDGKNVTKFVPAFPASCPFVTAVGGTTNINPEMAVSRFFSGGGFSNFFSRPQYQEKAVAKYLAALPKGTFNNLFNPQGRAYPDVAAQADRFRIFLKGRPVSIGGTSAAAPTFAGIVALLNDARFKAGHKSLGFLNPMLYSKGFEGLNDITIGHNSGCGTTGFNATEGWDPVTGLGTPNFFKLKDIVVPAKRSVYH